MHPQKGGLRTSRQHHTHPWSKEAVNDDKKENEMLDIETHEAILDSIPHRLVFVDCDHVIQYLNRAAKAWFYTKRGYDDLVGKSLFSCHKPESVQTLLALFQRLLQGEDAVFVKVTPEKEKASMMAVRDPQGRLIGYWERFEALAPEVPLDDHSHPDFPA